MANKIIKAGSRKTVLALLILFGPASLLIFISTRSCKHQFKELEDYGAVPAYTFKDVDGKSYTNHSFKDEIVIFTTIQTTCPKSCSIDLWQIDQQLFQNLKENPKKLGHVRIVSFVTDGEGNPSNKLKDVQAILENEIDGYDPKIWTLANGNSKEVFNFSNNGQTLLKKGKEYYGGEAFQELMLLVDKQHHLRMVLSGKSEGMVRTMKDHLALLEKQYDIEKARGK